MILLFSEPLTGTNGNVRSACAPALLYSDSRDDCRRERRRDGDRGSDVHYGHGQCAGAFSAVCSNHLMHPITVTYSTFLGALCIEEIEVEVEVGVEVEVDIPAYTYC
jgi:hypothetical protein